MSPVWSQAERAAIARAGKAGILVVVAAGNSSMDNDIQFYDQQHVRRRLFPAIHRLLHVLSVAAVRPDKYGYGSSSATSRRIPRWQCAFTSWGQDSVDVAAPGVDIVSTVAAGAGGDVGSATRSGMAPRWPRRSWPGSPAP